MKNILKNVFYYYGSFKGEANFKEFFIYFFIDLILKIIAIKLNNYNSLDSSILNLFYLNLILNLSFVPMQAAIIRRLNFAGINKGWIILNLIPNINIFFKLGLLFAKHKK